MINTTPIVDAEAWVGRLVGGVGGDAGERTTEAQSSQRRGTESSVVVANVCRDSEGLTDNGRQRRSFAQLRLDFPQPLCVHNSVNSVPLWFVSLRPDAARRLPSRPTP